MKITYRSTTDSGGGLLECSGEGRTEGDAFAALVADLEVSTCRLEEAVLAELVDTFLEARDSIASPRARRQCFSMPEDNYEIQIHEEDNND